MIAMKTGDARLSFDDDFGIRLDVMSQVAGRPEERARIVFASPPAKSRYPNAKIVDAATGRLEAIPA